MQKKAKNQLDEHWETSTWPQRYGYSSFDVNYRLQGGIPQGHGAHWTDTDVKAFVRWMNENCTRTGADTVLYRGSDAVTPHVLNTTAHQDAFVSRAFTSTSKSRKIAREFARKKGYVHVLHVAPGVRVFDMNQWTAVPAQREQEVLLLPGAKFHFRRQYASNTVHWDVS
jgi:hypothetical protein